MAFNLRAILKLDDQFTNPMRKITRQMQQTERMTKKMTSNFNGLDSAMGSISPNTRGIEKFGTTFSKITNAAQYQAYKMQSGIADASNKVLRSMTSMGNSSRNVLNSMGSGTKSILRGLTSMKAGFLGIAAAAGGAYTAVKIFKNTVGEAMKFEQASIMIDAMFDDKKVSERYKDMMQKMAIDSPLLNSQDIFGNSKSFIMLTKNTDQLKEMWSLVERLNAVDPAQGVEGAVFALKELFSGDARSMVERFEMDRQTLKGIKNLPLERQLVELDKYFNKMGITQKLINEMGGTTLGIWNQVQEQFQLVLRQMGEPSLKVLSGFFTNILDKLQNGELDKFASIGGKIIQSILNGLTSGAIKIYEWFQNLSRSEEFQKETTLFGKVKFVIEDILKSFNQWLDEEGKEKIEKVASSTITILAASIEASMEVIIPIAKKVGGGIARGVMDGFKENLDDSWFLQMVKDPVGYGIKKATGGKVDLGAKEKELDAKIRKKLNNKNKTSSSGSFASGLERVPYNGFQATLHKDERILTPEEAKEYRNGGGGVNVQIASLTVREEADIDKIAEALYTKINGALEAGA